nr:SMC-Scp complex subunit ScpB [Bacilli bacterium]
MDRTSDILTVQVSLAGSYHESLLPILEGLLFVAGTEGISSKEIARVLAIPEHDVEPLCSQVASWQNQQGRMFEAKLIAGAWQLVTVSSLSPYLERLAVVPTPAALSQAALEALAIIVYKQPITRSEVEMIRGVKSDRAIGTLIARGLIKEAGRAQGPGRPFLYETTKDVLEYFGLSSREELLAMFDRIAMADTDEKA